MTTFRNKIVDAMIGHDLKGISEALVAVLGEVLREADPAIRERVVEEACAEIARRAMARD